MADPEGKERLTNTEFRELIPHLPLADLLLIEFRKDKWQKLISVLDPVKRLFGCTLCGITNSNAKNLNAHMDGKKHKINMNDIRQFYHPEYTYMKYQQRLAEGGTPLTKNANRAAKSQSNINVSKSTVAKANASKVSAAATPSTSRVSAAARPPTPKVSATTTPTATKVSAAATPTTLKVSAAATPTSSKVSAAATPTTTKVSAAATPTTKNIAPVIKGATPKSKPVPIAIKSEKTIESVNETTVTETVTSTSPKTTTIATATETTMTAKTNSPLSNVVQTSQKDGEQMKIISEKPITSVNVALDQGKLTQSSNDENESVEPVDDDVIIILEDNNTKTPEGDFDATPKDQVNSDPKVENINGSNPSNSNTDDDKNKNTEQANLVKNPFAHANIADGQKKPMPKISVIATALLQEPKLLRPEIIVIDDEPPASDKDDTTMVGRQIPTIEKRVVSKPQRSQFIVQMPSVQDIAPQGNSNKRPTPEMSANKNINLEEPQTKKPKVVLNPAAAFLNAATNEQEMEATSDKNELPNYQKDKVIIPTVDKNKIIKQNQQANANANKRNEPKFSTKTFSSKPCDDDVNGLIGVEYVVKIMKSRSDRSPRYECSLCELILDGSSMQKHLVGYNHRMKFCEKHFPTALSQYQQYCANVPTHETFKVMTPILEKLAVAIEQHHGRDLPYECLENDFNLNRHAILSKLFSCRHASEQNGPSFTHVVDSREIDKYIGQKEFFKPQSAPQEQIFIKRPGPRKNVSQPPHRERRRENIVQQPHERPQERPPYSFVNYVAPIDDDIHKRMVDDFLRGTARSRSPHGRQRDRNRERRSRHSRERAVRRSRSRSGNEQNRKSLSPLRDGDIWQAYRHVVDRKINDLNEVFKLYHSDPETHPMYNDEWQKFWKRRKDELIVAGLDHRSYNYQPEWVRYFKVRIEELYSQAVENIKIQSRERLCLPMTNIYLSDSKYHVQAVDDIYEVAPSLDIRSNAENNESLTLPPYNEKTSTPEVVPVLRLMTALEENLGSLGPRIIDLMSKALLEDKTNPTHTNATILTLENCTLLETAMEKLKGVLYAGLLDGPKERAFKKVISDTGALLSFAEEERKKNPPKPKIIPPTFSNKPSYGSTQLTRTSAPVPVPAPVPAPQTSQLNAIAKGTSSAIATLLAQMDKKELASKLAATLTAQGKTDFSPDQLEQLIAVYTLIEKKKREAAADATEATSREPPASSITRTTLSDTLANFMNPSNPNSAPVILKNPIQSSATVPVDSGAKKAYTVATVNRYLDIMRRTGGNASISGDPKANDIWQNLQNIQRGLNMSNVIPNQNLNSQSPSSSENLGSSTMPQNNNFGVMNLAQLGFQTQNPYLAMTAQPQLSHWQQPNNSTFNMQSKYNYLGNMSGAGNLFTNSNSSRVDTNNISINTTQSSERNETANQPNPNQKWRENLNKNQNARGGGGDAGGGGALKKNAGGKNKGGGGGGQNKNRNYRNR